MSLLTGSRSRFSLGEIPEGLRPDQSLVSSMVEPESRLIDIGCGDGALLDFLVREKGCDGRGIELSQAGVNACVARGLSAIQGDADTDLVDYPDKSFDVAILSQTLQAVHRPRDVLTEMLRIADTAIVSILNYGHWRARMHMLLKGRMPHTRVLAAPWFETANIHPCTVKDFLDLVRLSGLRMASGYGLANGNDVSAVREGFEGQTNWFAEQAVFEIYRPETARRRRG